jgi:ATP-dependent DNA helicase PIF1
MRANEDELQFSEYLLNVGQGKEDIFDDLGEFKIKIPDEYLVKSGDELIERVFPNLSTNQSDSKELIEGAIYTPLNTHVKEFNDICMHSFPGRSKTYLSSDSILEQDHQAAVPPEYLNAMSISGLPDHKLELKLWVRVMLLRNLQGGQQNGVRNGTFVIVMNMMDRCLECEVAVGTQKGLRVFLSCIPHHDSSGDFPFTIVQAVPCKASLLHDYQQGKLLYYKDLF